jgi:hypothetical protein
LLTRFYSIQHLEEDIMIILDPSQTLDVDLPREWRPPSLRFSFKVVNASPYLDIRVKRVSVFLMVRPGELEEIFAEACDWDEFDVRRGESEHCLLTLWLNEFQTHIVRACHENRMPVNATVFVAVESVLGRAVPFKLFQRITPTVK